ncbi:hypothetical protein EV702DRAFT_1051924 [Suillus placidus]|uniref:Uncharacterized protein n=1 Tax=Suillus placidus TaxID=48579 RepID=A0A9P6ZFF8_9AGAM|nr:hypothetical protein EV702DRAFT_1051924 [Suillus placidus]
MHFHYSLGIGHVYSHKAKIPEHAPNTATLAESNHSGREGTMETTNWPVSTENDEEGEEDEEGGHLGVEELNAFEQEESLGVMTIPGYLAINQELSPIYCPSASYSSVNSEHDVLEIVGILAIPHNRAIMFPEVYQKWGGDPHYITYDGAFMLAINSEFSQPNVLGEPSLVWPITALNDHIRFNQLQFPDGFPPPTIVEATPFLHGFMPPALPATIKAIPFPQVLQLSAPPATDQEFEPAFLSSISPSADASWSDYDYDYVGTVTGSENYHENSIASGHHLMVTSALPLFLTKCLYLGSLWVGLANPWDQELHDGPRFSGDTEDEKNARVDYFYDLLNSNQHEQVQHGIMEIAELQMFVELLWFALLQPTNGLIKGNGPNKVLGIGVMVTLMTLIYQTLHQWHTPKVKGRKHTRTYSVMMYALRGMYDDLDQFPRFRNVVRRLPFLSAANVFPMDSKNPCPKTCVGHTSMNKLTRRQRFD